MTQVASPSQVCHLDTGGVTIIVSSDCVSTLLRLGSVQVALQRLRPSREAPVCEREGEASIVTTALLHT